MTSTARKASSRARATATVEGSQEAVRTDLAAVSPAEASATGGAEVGPGSTSRPAMLRRLSRTSSGRALREVRLSGADLSSGCIGRGRVWSDTRVAFASFNG